MKKTIFISLIILFILLVIGYIILTQQESEEANTNVNTSNANTNINTQATWYIPQPGITWQWQLSGAINTTHDVALYDIDLINTPQATIDQLHSNGSKVICYFSAGSWESFREDASDFPDEVIGKTLDGWQDEKWLDISNYENFASTIRQRLDTAVQKKCDGVEPDNVDGYQNDSGFDLTYEDQRNYNQWLASEAHKRNLSIALKNDLDQVDDLVGYFDFAINEQCFEYDECETLLPFIQNNKAVLGVEYNLDTDEFCETAASMNFSWLKMNLDLDGSRVACN
ncbi:endo alpha-1,4 polygalactosaminidase [Patescibacteria group bacterium]